MSEYGTPHITAIVAAAGVGSRFGPERDKSFLELNGKPLVLWSVETLHAMPEISEIIPVLRREDRDRGQRLFEQHGITKIRRIAVGGPERQDSVYNGLLLIADGRDQIVLIHDAARPLAEREMIRRMIAELLREKPSCDGVIPAVPVKDTIKEVKRDTIVRTLDRDALRAVQTPQIFWFDKILRVYERALEQKEFATDDAALLERYGGKIKVTTGSYRNIKITTPEDLTIAEALVRENPQR